MWQIEPDVKSKLVAALQTDTDREAADFIQFLFETDCDPHEGGAIRRRDFDPQTGRFHGTHPLTGDAFEGVLSPTMLQRVNPEPQDPEAPLFRLMDDDPMGYRVQAVIARVGPALGVSALPAHRRRPAQAQRMTRACMKPWNALEITATGATRHCCMVPRDEAFDLSKTPTLEQMMGAAYRKSVQNELLQGDLNSFCQHCTIMPMVPVEVMQRQVAARPLGQADLPTEVFIELTTDCNLRCTYCTVTAEGYLGMDLREDHIDSVLRMTRTLPPTTAVSLNGHGELTIHPGWSRLCEGLLDQGFRPFILTNMARAFSDEEVALMSRLSVIQISLDSADATMMRRIRKAITPDRILKTVERIRAAAQGTPPAFCISAGIYDPSIWTLPEFADWIVENGFLDVTFWNLMEFSHQTLVAPLSDLDPEQTAKARANIAIAREKFAAAGVHCRFLGDFLAADGAPFMSEPDMPPEFRTSPEQTPPIQAQPVA